jgi:hypothetical protein
MAQVVPITSEALQATIRRLLPSQNGFGEDLQASNVILPTLDITPTAEGSQLPSFLQTALSITGTTTFGVNNTTTTVANSPGFYVLRANAYVGSTGNLNLNITTGGVSSAFWALNGAISGAQAVQYNFTVFLDTGDALNVVSNNTNGEHYGYVYQIADRYGNLNNPGGFTFE